MRPGMWEPPVEPSPTEQAVIKAVRRARLFVFLRQHRHELFDEELQAELAAACAGSPKGQPPVPPAQLALATILQACTGVSDDEVIEATVMDRCRVTAVALSDHSIAKPGMDPADRFQSAAASARSADSPRIEV
jgi:hypothetical protein